MDGQGRTEGPYGEIEVVRAGGSDLDTVLSILEEALWLVRRGIDRWEPVSFSRRRIADRIGHGEMYLARSAGQNFGTFALQWSDEEVWGAVPGDAGYVHGLAIRRDFAGRGLGLELLRWVKNMWPRRANAFSVSIAGRITGSRTRTTSGPVSVAADGLGSGILR